MRKGGEAASLSTWIQDWVAHARLGTRMGYQGQEWDTSLALLGCIWEEKKVGLTQTLMWEQSESCLPNP